MGKLVAHHLCGALEFKRFKQPAVRVEAHHHRFAFQGDVEALLNLSIFARHHTHGYCACLCRVFIFGGLIRGWDSESQVNRRDKTGSEIIDLLRLLDPYPGHGMFTIP